MLPSIGFALADRFATAGMHVVLADEINRTSPKVQSAMLEAMAESITGQDIPHPAPFGLALGAGLMIWQWMRPTAAAAAAP